MNTADIPRKHNRRAADRYPLTSRIHWRLMAWMDRHIGGVVGTLFMTFFWALLAFCLLSPQP